MVVAQSGDEADKTRRSLEQAGWGDMDERSVAYDEEGEAEGERVTGEVVIFHLKMNREGVETAPCHP